MEIFESRCVIGAGSYLKNCVVLPEARISDGSSIEDALVGPDYVMRLEKEKRAAPPYFSEDMLERFFQRSSRVLEFRLIGTGGSDRKYYRLRYQGKSAVLMVCSPDDPDYERHITYTAFFRRHSLPVPEMFEADEGREAGIIRGPGRPLPLCMAEMPERARDD